MPERSTPLRFALAITCIDGRVQRPVVEYLRTRYGFDYVDLITEPGPELALTSPDRDALRATVRKNARFSLSAHHGELLAIAAHDDCAGSGGPAEERRQLLARAAALLRTWEPEVPILSLWVGANGTVREMAGTEEAALPPNR